MGRSRGAFQSAVEEITQRTRRKRNALGGESTETRTRPGEGKKALYHCNYCNKDITGKIRIKCAACSDFDLCVECFSVGAEVTPHKSNHPYRVMDNLSFPLITPDWNADEEMLLLEGIEMYGLWNWVEVSEHVGSKSKEQCIAHYSNIYLNSPVFPRPQDMSHIPGKNRKDLVIPKVEDKKVGTELISKEESSFSPLPRGANPRMSSKRELKEGSNSNCTSREARISGEGRPNPSCDETTPLPDQSGYNPKRGEFDPEYDNDAEQMIAEMEFKDNDTEEVREMKLRMLRAYSKRLDERKRRKDFILERKLLRLDPVEADMSSKEEEICRSYDVFMRLRPKKEHDEFLHAVIAEHRFRVKIEELREAQVSGCRSSDEAEKYIAQRKKRDSLEATDASFLVDRFDVTGCSGVDLLSEAERRLCSELRLFPAQYMRMQRVMTLEIFRGKVVRRSDAHRLFNIEPRKVDRVYDVLVNKGVAQP